MQTERKFPEIEIFSPTVLSVATTDSPQRHSSTPPPHRKRSSRKTPASSRPCRACTARNRTTTSRSCSSRPGCSRIWSESRSSHRARLFPLLECHRNRCGSVSGSRKGSERETVTVEAQEGGQEQWTPQNKH